MDGSDRGYSNGSDPAALLDKFETMLAAGNDPAAWLDLLAEGPTAAVIWGRVLSAAARNPALAAELGPLDAVVGSLAVSPLGAALSQVISAQFSGVDAHTRTKVEETVRALEPAEDVHDGPSYQAQQLYRHLLHTLDPAQVTDDTKAAIEATQPVDDHGVRVGGPVDFDRYFGVDLTDPADKAVSELLDVIEPFMHAHYSELPTEEQLYDHDAAIGALELVVDAGYAELPRGPRNRRARADCGYLGEPSRGGRRRPPPTCQGPLARRRWRGRTGAA